MVARGLEWLTSPHGGAGATDDLALVEQDAPGAAAPVDVREVELHEIEGLRRALETRTAIGEAVGIVKTQRTLTADCASAHLVERSSRSNVKVRDVAAAIVAEAELRARQPEG